MLNRNKNKKQNNQRFTNEGRTTTHTSPLPYIPKNDLPLHCIKALLHKRVKKWANLKNTKIDKINKIIKRWKSENRQNDKSDKMQNQKKWSKHEMGQKRGGMSLNGVNVTLRVFRAIWWGHFCHSAWTPVFCVFGLRTGFHDFWWFLMIFDDFYFLTFVDFVFFHFLDFWCFLIFVIFSLFVFCWFLMIFDHFLLIDIFLITFCVSFRCLNHDTLFSW